MEREKSERSRSTVSCLVFTQRYIPSDIDVEFSFTQTLLPSRILLDKSSIVSKGKRTGEKNDLDGNRRIVFKKRRKRAPRSEGRFVEER